MRFNYKNKQLVVQGLRETKKELWKFVDLKKNKLSMKWEVKDHEYSLRDYSKFFYPNIVFIKLDELIDQLESLSGSKSKYLDFEEFIFDLGWIKHYYLKEKRYTSVIRWLSNIESTIHKLFEEYMDEIKSNPDFYNKDKNYKQNHYKTTQT